MKRYFTKNGIELTVVKPMSKEEKTEHEKQQDITYVKTVEFQSWQEFCEQLKKTQEGK